MTAPEPADLARQHGAPWAKQLTEDELMKMEQYDFGASEKPAKRVRYVDTGWLLGLGIVACVSGMVALVMLAGGMW